MLKKVDFCIVKSIIRLLLEIIYADYMFCKFKK